MLLNHFSYRGSPEVSEITGGAWKSQNSYYGVRFPGIRKHRGRSVMSVKSAPAGLGGQQLNLQIRRHMQRSEREEVDEMKHENQDERRYDV